MADYAQFQASAYAIDLRETMSLTSVEISAILFAPYVPAILLGLPFGALGDKFGAKWIVGCCFAVTVVACCLRSLCSSFLPLFLASVAIGIGPSSLNSNLVKIFGYWFADRTDFAMGCYYACGSGGIATVLATAFLFPDMTYAYFVAGAAIALLLVAWVGVMKDSPSDVDSADGVQTMQSIVAVVKCGPLWVIAVLLGLGLAGTTAFSGYLMPAFEYTVDAGRAGFLASAFTWGSIVGCVGGPLLRGLFNSYKICTGLLTTLGSIALAATCLTVRNPSVALIFLSGALTAASGPVFQGLPYMLREVHGRYEGGAGGLVSTESLALTYALPISVSAVCGDDFIALLCASAAFVPLTLIFIALLPAPGDLVDDAEGK
ncbi:MAG: MFS transporter [Eggerthellaceae bacterium]|jgi:MFS family permease